MMLALAVHVSQRTEKKKKQKRGEFVVGCVVKMDRQRGTSGHVVVREGAGQGAKTHYRREVLGLHTKTKKSTRKRNSKRRVHAPLTLGSTLFRAKRPIVDSNNRPLP